MSSDSETSAKGRRTQQQTSAQAKTAAASNVFASVNMAMFPVTLTEDDVAMHIDTDIEAMMSKEQVHETWTKIFSKYRITHDDDRRKLIIGIMRYFIANGSSPRGPYDGNIMVNGQTYAVRRVKEVLGKNVRRFCRAQADLARSILKADEDFAISVGNRWGFFESYDLAFDFSDYCTGLIESELELIATVRRRTLSNTNPYKTTVDVTTPAARVGPPVYHGEQGNGSIFHQ